MAICTKGLKKYSVSSSSHPLWNWRAPYYKTAPKQTTLVVVVVLVLALVVALVVVVVVVVVVDTWGE